MLDEAADLITSLRAGAPAGWRAAEQLNRALTRLNDDITKTGKDWQSHLAFFLRRDDEVMTDIRVVVEAIDRLAVSPLGDGKP